MHRAFIPESAASQGHWLCAFEEIALGHLAEPRCRLSYPTDNSRKRVERRLSIGCVPFILHGAKVFLFEVWPHLAARQLTFHFFALRDAFFPQQRRARGCYCKQIQINSTETIGFPMCPRAGNSAHFFPVWIWSLDRGGCTKITIALELIRFHFCLRRHIPFEHCSNK